MKYPSQIVFRQPSVHNRETAFVRSSCTDRRVRIAFLCILMCLVLGGCASKQHIEVVLSNLAPARSSFLEPQVRIDLHIRNFSERPIKGAGMTLEFDVNGSRFARGVSNQKIDIPALGESVNSIVIGISVFDVVRQLLITKGRQTFSYELRGKIVGEGSASRNIRFKHRGELSKEQLNSFAGNGVR